MQTLISQRKLLACSHFPQKLYLVQEVAHSDGQFMPTLYQFSIKATNFSKDETETFTNLKYSR